MVHIRRVGTSLRMFMRFMTSANFRPRKQDFLLHHRPAWTSLHLCKDECVRHYLPVCTVLRPDLGHVGYSTGAGKDSSQPGTRPSTDPAAADPDPEDDGDDKKLSTLQRFKKAYKQHGKILLTVHVSTSLVWFGSFYTAIHFGVDIIPLLENIGLSDRLINPLRNSSVGDLAMAYLLYKLVTPPRYLLTIGGTNLVIGLFRKTGRMEPQQEKLRDLVKESGADFKQEMTERKTALKDKQTEMMMKVKNQQTLKKDGLEQNNTHGSSGNTKDGQSIDK